MKKIIKDVIAIFGGVNLVIILGAIILSYVLSYFVLVMSGDYSAITLFIVLLIFRLTNLFDLSYKHFLGYLGVVFISYSSIGFKLQSVFDNKYLSFFDYPTEMGLSYFIIFIFVISQIDNVIRINKKLLFSANTLFCLIIILFLFFKYRGADSYQYYPLFTSYKLPAYLDCVAMILMIYVFSSFFTALIVKYCDLNHRDEGVPKLNPGKPINKDEINEDYEYTEYIDSISPIIIDNFDEQVSVSVGISGAWGSGKTTFLHALQKQIEQDKRVASKDRVLIEFKPWFCEKKTDLVQEFFKVYRERMGKRISGFDSDIMEYAKVLTENVDKLKWANQVMKLCTPVESIQKQFDAITDKLKRYKIPVYIIIDDLDRLDGEEIMEILRLIRITANFPYTQFILAYDKPYIQKAIKKQLDYDESERFIDKVINTEICLPHFDHRAIGDLLYNELAAYCDDVKDMHFELLNWNPVPRKNSDSSFASIITSVLPTFRDVHRFVNMFKLDFDKFSGKQEVDFRDFFTLSLIKYAYPEFYKMMGLSPLDIFKIEKNCLLFDDERKSKDDDLNFLLCSLFNIRGSEFGNRDDEYIIRKEQLYVCYRENYNKYFQFKTPAYQYNVLELMRAIDDQNLDYIKQKESSIRGNELERVLSLIFSYYHEQNSSKELKGLISYTDLLLDYQANYTREIRAAFLSYLRLPGSFNEEVYLQILSVLVKHDADKDPDNSIITSYFFNRKITCEYSYFFKGKEIIASSISVNTIRSLSLLLIYDRISETIFQVRDIYQIQSKIFSNIFDSHRSIVYKIEAYEALKNYDSTTGHLIHAPFPKFKNKLRNYILERSTEYIRDFIHKSENEWSNFSAYIFPLPNSKAVLSDSDIDFLFEKEKGNNVPNYANALKLWNWLKINKKESYEYNDPTQTKTVDQWIAEGMPGLE